MFRTRISAQHIGKWMSILAMFHLFTYTQGVTPQPEEEEAGVRLSAEPADVAVERGARALLTCGAPGATLRWRYASAADAAPHLWLAEGDTTRHVLSNGSLVVEPVDESTAGQYQCVASKEGVGTVLSRVALLSIVSLGAFVAQPRTTRVRAGEAALLQCAAGAARRVIGATPHADRRRLYGGGTVPPPPDEVAVTVTWLKNGAVVTLDPARMSLMPSGALEIDPTRASDEGLYRCNVSLASGSQFRLSNKAELQVVTDLTLAEAVEPPRFIATPPTLTVLEGSTVTFDCAAVGNPRPEIIWLNNGVTIDLNDLDSRFFRVGVGSLRIESVRALDAGAYTCRAHNREDSEDATAELHVLVPPKFTSRPPTHVRAVARGDVELPCAARGRPVPRARWFKDGEPLTPNNHDMAIVNGNNLRIQGVLTLDAGMFQCIVSSPAGNAQTSVLLTVLPAVTTQSKPTKPTKGTKQRPKSSKAINNKYNNNSDKYAKTNASEMPKDSAINPKSILTSLISTDTGDLPYSEEDSYNIDDEKYLNTHDIFTSLASSNSDVDIKKHRNSQLDRDTNFLGEVSSAFTTVSNRKTVREPQNHNLDIDFEEKPSLSGDIEHHWDFNAPVTELVPFVGHANPGEGLDEISTLSTEEIVVEDGATTGPEARITGAETDVKQRMFPSEPRDLKAVIVKPRFVTLSWSEPASPNGEIEAYAVIYKVKEYIRERVLNTTRPDVHEMNIPSLQPDTPYLFRVVAYNKAGPGTSTPILEITTQPEDNVIGPPTEVTVVSDTPTSLLVSWNAPEPNERNIPVQKYQLFWMEADTTQEQHTDTQETQYSLTNLAAYTEYTVWVTAVPPTGTAATSDEATARTLGDTPELPPGNVSAEPSTSSSVVVRWEPPPPKSVRGALTGYKLRYRPAWPAGASGPGPGRRRADSLTTPADARSAVLRGLERAVTYQVRICALNVNGSGPFSEWVLVETSTQDLDESHVPGEPGPLRTRAARDSIAVWWSAPGAPAVRVRGYSLGWGVGIPDVQFQGLDESARHFVIRDLEPDSDYVISLRAVNNLGEGRPVYANVRTRIDVADDDEVSEDEDAAHAAPPLIPPVGLKVIVLSGTTAVVYWTDTTLTKSQLVTDNRRYVVRYTAVGSARHRYFNATDLNCMIDELKPHTQYEFAVKLLKGGRESPWSMVVSNTTLETPPGSPPRDLTVRATGSAHSVELKWAPPARANGVITGYVIMYTTEASRRDRDWVAQAVVGGARIARVTGLRPRTAYHFKMQARNARGYGPFTQHVTFVTMAESGGAHWSLTLYLCVGGACVVVTLAAVVAVTVCCRRGDRRGGPPDSPDRPGKSTYQKSSASANIKPPDLWIHHDQMELKQLDKSHHSSSVSGTSCDNASAAMVSSSLTLPRAATVRDSGDYEPAHRHVPVPPVGGSLDARHYVPTYVASSITPPPAPPSNVSDETAPLTRGHSPASVASSERAPLRLRAPPLFSLGTERPMASVSSCLSAGCERAGTCGARGVTTVQPPSASRPHLTAIDQNTPLLAGGGNILNSPQSSLGSLGPHHPAMTCAVSACPLGAACTVGGDIYARAARERGHYVAYEPLGPYAHREQSDTGGASTAGSLPRRTPAHPLHSFGAPPPPPGDVASDTSLHSTPSHHAKVTVRPSNTSPYKKTSLGSSSASGSPGHIANRLQLGATVQHTPDELESLTPSRSTERLNREMANLEGLMKDLSAITQQQFQC